MQVDQEEIDALLEQADKLSNEATVELGNAPDQPAPDPVPKGPSQLLKTAPPDVARLLRIRVPVIVRLAQRRLTVASVRGLSCGGIIEFDKDIGQLLDLMINNHLIGGGEAMKIGEYFGLRIRQIETKEQRIRSMGG